MRVASLKELPTEYRCRLCREVKPIAAMIVVRVKRENKILLRPRCKECHNARERGHRREWKTAYLRRWRKYNDELTRSYWKKRSHEEWARAAERFRSRNHLALLIQGRLRRRIGMHVKVSEARRLLNTYGPCYPTRYGLTAKGLREFERIRSNMRRIGKHLHPVEIRMMVYEDGKSNFIKPRFQPIPYQIAAQRLRDWQAQRKAA